MSRPGGRAGLGRGFFVANDRAAARTTTRHRVSRLQWVRDYHDQMPAIIPPEDHCRWLSNVIPEKGLMTMLRPFAADHMTARLVNCIVNRATAEGPECLGLAE